MTSFLYCPACDGIGEHRIPGSSVNPFSGVRSHDPQEDHCETCRVCHGTGFRHTAYRDSVSFDQLSDERAEQGESSPFPEPARDDDPRIGVRIHNYRGAHSHTAYDDSGASIPSGPGASADPSIERHAA